MSEKEYQQYYCNALVNGAAKMVACGKAIHDKIIQALGVEKQKTQELELVDDGDFDFGMNWDRITYHQPKEKKSGFRSISDDWEVTQDS